MTDNGYVGKQVEKKDDIDKLTRVEAERVKQQSYSREANDWNETMRKLPELQEYLKHEVKKASNP